MKKLILIPSLIFLSSQLNAQVNAGTMLSSYTDINPDSLMNYTVAPYTHETYGLNIFGDAAADIEFTAHGAVSSGGSAAYISVISLNPDVSLRFGRLDSVYSPGSSSWIITDIAKPLNAGEQINSSAATWETTQLYLTDHSGSGGGNKNVNDWIGADKYLGMKYENGWVRIQCPTEDACYVKDFSSGNTSVGITEIAETGVFVFPNPAREKVTLTFANVVPEAASFKLYDLYSRQLDISLDRTAHSVILGTSELAPGCYVLCYELEGKLYSKRIMKSAN
jgi:hypothetical protein